MPSLALTPTPKTYAQLREAVIAVVVQGRQAIDRAWLQTYHETGRLINEHVLLFKDRADYGAKTYKILAADTDISERTLRQCAQFHRCYPIWHTCAKLDWSKCRLLCEVMDPKAREQLRVQTIKHEWTALELETRVRQINATLAVESNHDEATPDEPIELLTPRCGTPGLHPIVDRGAGPEVDLGFKFYRELGSTSNLTTKDIVRLNDDGVRKVDSATRDQLFTYTATVRKIVDGDTLVVAFALAPGFTHELKLRLRGLDCPEVATAAGRAAKAFVDALLKPGDEIIVSTTKPDKYDRYLADVFVSANAAKLTVLSGQASASEADRRSLIAESFLNNLLLRNRHAIRYDGGAKEE